MSKKAVLIFDTPESCNECPCYNAQVNECNIVKKEIITIATFGYMPSWCPLIETDTGTIKRMQRIRNKLENERMNRL